MTHPHRTRRSALASLGLISFGLLGLMSTASAQGAFPTKPITIIVPFAPGGIADITARTVAQAMAPGLGQSVVVENKPSAGSIVAGQAVAAAAKDGHTLLLMSNANAVSASLFKQLPFDAQKDFAPISTLGYFDLVVAVPADSPFKSLKDLVAQAKAQPGKINIGTIAVGSTQHLAAELFKTQAGIDAVTVPYKASPAVINALRTGEIQAAIEILGPSLGQIQSGAIRALATTSDQRNSTLPDLPTVMESGVARYDVESWNALAAPIGTPPEVIDRINQAVRVALAMPEVRKRLQDLGVRAQTSTPAQLQSLLVRETQRWHAVIQAAKIEAQ